MKFHGMVTKILVPNFRGPSPGKFYSRKLRFLFRDLSYEESWCAHKKIISKVWNFFPLQFSEPKNLDFNFAKLRLYGRYLHNAKGCHQSENDIANYRISLKRLTWP